MRWSDPRQDNEDLNQGKARFKFTEEDFNMFKDLIGFDILIRGHQVQVVGYKEFFHNNIINIFSSGKILLNNKDINTETAYSKVNPHIIKIDENGEVIYISLN